MVQLNDLSSLESHVNHREVRDRERHFTVRIRKVMIVSDIEDSTVFQGKSCLERFTWLTLHRS